MDVRLPGRALAVPWLAVMLVFANPPQSDDGKNTGALDRYRNLTSVSTDCRSSNGDEITVCGRRHDEYRLDRTIDSKSFANSKDDVRTERADLLKDRSQSRCGMGATLSGCGSVGVTVKVGM